MAVAMLLQRVSESVPDDEAEWQWIIHMHNMHQLCLKDEEAKSSSRTGEGTKPELREQE